jgi:hypothetical protein
VLTSFVVFTISAILFAYWFRYACLLVLSARKARDYRQDVAAANNLTFMSARKVLVEDSGVDAELVRSLDRDYTVVVYLLRHATLTEPGELPVEQWLLRLDYRLMSAWYRIARFVSSTAARKALIEMTSIIGHLANKMGERTASARP